jgi:hypothetical protein
MKLIALVMIALMLTGCSSIVMQTPFPDTDLTKEEMSSLRGTWQLGEAALSIEFTTNGLPRMAFVEWKDGRFQLVERELHVTRRKDAYYLSLQAEEQGHLFAAFKPQQNEILVWGPDPAFFKNRIASGELKGSIKEESQSVEIMLTTPAHEILELIATEPAAIDYTDPLILKKLK